MSFVVRAVQREDLQSLFELARQFTLLNLPPDPAIIEQKIDRSLASFRGDLSKDDAEYLFIAQDTESGAIAGSSLILAKNGTPTQPNYSFRIIKREHFSPEIGIGFIHQILKLHAHVDGPTEVGGLVVDRAYRGRPEKVGRLISLSRFVYIGMRPAQFEDSLHSEMVAALAADGKSEFWEALGRRFTGMTYEEADQISGRSNAFIPRLFPSEDIYLALLDTDARLSLGRVGKETEGALHMLNRIGFTYKDEVDPFDGGPHLGCPTAECTLIKNLRRLRVARAPAGAFDREGLIGLDRDVGFVGTATPYRIEGEGLLLPEKTWTLLGLGEGEDAFVTPF